MKRFLIIQVRCIFVLFFSVLMFCCSRQETQYDVVEISFEDAPADFKLTDRFKNVHFVQLEMTDECVINFEKKIALAENRILVSTIRNELYCFDSETGKFICRVGERGEGPGEYLSIKDFYYNSSDSSIVILDAFKNRTLSYSLDGEYLKEGIFPASVNYVESIERSQNDYYMLSLMMHGGENEYAYTVVRPDSSYFSFDPFAPVSVGNYMTAYADQPMAAFGNGFTFQKCLNDTIFRLDNGEIRPEYKLLMNKPLATKEQVANLGPYHKKDVCDMALSTGYFIGFDRIYETQQYILLIQPVQSDQGYFWIDKESNTGIRIASSNNMSKEAERAIEGKSIISVKGGNDKALISFIMPATINFSFKGAFERNPEIKPFSDQLRPFFENTDPEGNPIVIIYEQ